ncbi:hypothetical protein PR202_gb25611 [Eleusine coracana subsp. coracana]|uniref:Uncharacterized protein n=1 Tax=Eleusine coracana subsp. coracana TaxID=191504 RepID=A0AAV5FR24_ELECO|nr:hypothetical protein PR202_gb25611 [Eleusine coracana subsp. coracana]
MQGVLLLLLLVFISSLFLLLSHRRGGKNSHCRFPPSPRGLPLVGNLHQLIGSKLHHHTLGALAAVHGPVMLLRLGRLPVIVVSSADAAQEVLQAQDHVFAGRPTLSVPRMLLYGCTDIAFAPYGPYWRGVRKMSVQHLLGPARVRATRAVREQEAEALVRRVAGHADAGGVLRLSEVLVDYAKDVMGRIVLGTRAAGDDGWRAKLDVLMDDSIELLGAFHVGDCLPWLSWVADVDGTNAKTRRAFLNIDRILDEIVDGAEREMNHNDGALHNNEAEEEAFVHVLLSLHKEPDGTEWRLNRDNVKALLEDLFGAGMEAAIIVLEWAMAELLRHKGAMKKLQHEIRQQQANGGLMVREQDLQGTEYLRCVVKETLRLHSPAPLLLPHVATQATRIINQRYEYDVPSNAMVIVNGWAIGRNPATWESPEEFRPERFIGSEVDFRGQHFQFIPFGSGRRMCPALNLTVAMVEIALANLVGRFDWALPEEDKELDMEESPGLAVRKKVPLRAIAIVPSRSSGH